MPVYNEADDLRPSIERLHGYLSEQFPLSWRVTIADNASTDRTWAIACDLACELKGVRAVHLDRKGRGRALREVWSASTAAVVAYMDVDLSTDLDALLPLVAPLVSGHSDVAIGTRLASGARVVRGPKREVISRTYNLLLKATMRSGFSDAQCGFKAVRADVARELLPMVEDQEWFFDTELLLLAEHNGLRIHEVPVDWVDDADSRVDVVGTAAADLRGIWRMARQSSATGRACPLTRPARPRSTRSARLGSGSPDWSARALPRSGSSARSCSRRCSSRCRGRSAGSAPTSSRSRSARSRTPRPTAGSRSRCEDARDARGTTSQDSPSAACRSRSPCSRCSCSRAIGSTSLFTAIVALVAVNGVATVARFALLRNWVFRRVSPS